MRISCVISLQEYAESMRIMNEWFFVRCDQVTRQTGRLTKCARFVQIRGFSMRALNREWMNMDAALAKDMEDCYPQLVGLIVCLDPPQWALLMWRAAKFLFPARMVEKIDLISTSSRNEFEKRARRFVALEHLPESFGGR